MQMDSWKSTVVLAVLVVGGVLAGTPALLSPARAEDGEIAGIDWLHDLDAARAKARETGRPILAVFR